MPAAVTSQTSTATTTAGGTADGRAAEREVAIECAVHQRQFAILEIDRAACPHATATAISTSATLDPEAFDVGVIQREFARSGNYPTRIDLAQVDRRATDREGAQIRSAAHSNNRRAVGVDRDIRENERRRGRPERIGGIHRRSCHCVNRPVLQNDRVVTASLIAAGDDKLGWACRVGSDVVVIIRGEDGLLQRAGVVAVNSRSGGSDDDRGGRRDLNSEDKWGQD